MAKSQPVLVVLVPLNGWYKQVSCNQIDIQQYEIFGYLEENFM